MITIRTSWLTLMLAGLWAVLTTPLAAADEPFPDRWQFTAGLGAADVPLYPGSDRRRYLALPAFSISYGRFFLGNAPGASSAPGAGLGVNAYQDSHWRLGALVSGDFITPRKAANDPHLHGLGDINSTARATLFASYTLDWATLRTNVSTDIGGHGEGTLAGLDLEGRYRPIERLTLSAGPGMTWASGPYMRTFFGVDAAQSAASGLPQFQATSGLDAVHFSLGADYRLTTAWNLRAHASLARLRGDAADSPITETRSQNSYALFATYRF
jgi:outer membrane protein